MSRRIRRHVEEVEHLATHDELTGLANRHGFRRGAEKCVESATYEQPAAVLLVDLGGLREVNDAFGSENGDALLVESALRLLRAAPYALVTARVGGDKFALLASSTNRPEAAELAEVIRHALTRPYELNGVRLTVDANVGIGLAPEHGTTPGVLLRRAEAAMRLAQERRSKVEVYDPTDDSSDVSRLALLTEFEHALASGQLVLHYQPQIDLGSGLLRGVEALVRWQHPRDGLLGPGSFVPIVERSGLVRELGRFVLEEAARQCHEWRLLGLDLELSVNVGAADLLDLSLPQYIAGVLERHSIPPERLVLEITESSLVRDEERSAHVLARLRDLGLRLAIDDFGTGYSSLVYLRRLPVQELKIDRAFVAGMLVDPADGAIVRSTIELAHGLGLAVVAEGVESPEQLAYLRATSCDHAQGYHIARPLPGDELLTFAQTWPDIRPQAAA